MIGSPLHFALLLQLVAGDIRGKSGQVVISGPVPLICTVTLAEDRVLIDLNSRGPQALGAVTYVCNGPDGLVRRVSSENGGALVQGEFAIPYMLEERGSSSLAFAFQQLAAPLITEVAEEEGLVDGLTEELRLIVPVRPPELVAGEYVDTVIIEITPN